MPISWNPAVQLSDSNQQLHVATLEASDEKALQSLVDEAVKKAVDMLDENLFDDAMFMLFEWKAEERYLDIGLCDASKKKDGKHRVRALFPENLVPATDLLQYWLKDYLSTYTPFLQYSLIAGFTEAGREQTQLL